MQDEQIDTLIQTLSPDDWQMIEIMVAVKSRMKTLSGKHADVSLMQRRKEQKRTYQREYMRDYKRGLKRTK